ncbi:TIGR03905 family TSCPD domain-containing protein [Clostridium fallax]|uniref:ribonucleoside-diphosphate reductase n=1 Tax=Clostridium fallax TaxID=1533 RepID=A0A1M4WMF7_9CLOT|nr:TIGR03905 family TSCPD domain-containing protein [Clostridium fallax]SHE82384.1 uncharacterized protein TIGR03905 [Clostridium fallax]SQB06230.1 uncharacterized protein TIGR03905 [Clostridium fallax]
MYSYKTSGVCSKEINFDIVDGKVSKVSFTGGCPGNLKGISALVEGMKIDEAITRLKGLTCGDKESSCPDQLSKALEEYLKSN